MHNAANAACFGQRPKYHLAGKGNRHASKEQAPSGPILSNFKKNLKHDLPKDRKDIKPLSHNNKAQISHNQGEPSPGTPAHIDHVNQVIPYVDCGCRKELLSMIYVTGDIHANLDIGKISTKRFPQQKQLGKNDYLIILGDFGLVWDGSNEEMYWRNWLSQKSFTTLWLDGNHENFDYLKSFPEVAMFGGTVQKIAPDIYHLLRGQVFTIEGKTFFVMGGAASHDRHHRKEHISWWKEEMPSSLEMESAINSLDKVGWKVDYVLTHCAPRSVQTMLEPWYENDPLVSFLDRVRSDLIFKRWYFGHYHIDKQVSEQFFALYNRIIPIG